MREPIGPVEFGGACWTQRYCPTTHTHGATTFGHRTSISYHAGSQCHDGVRPVRSGIPAQSINYRWASRLETRDTLATAALSCLPRFIFAAGVLDEGLCKKTHEAAYSSVDPVVGIITANYDPLDLGRYRPAKPVIIGDHCWLGMNSVILPGVTLGAHTIVAAGSVVTRSFPDGLCVLAGAPARLVKSLSPASLGEQGLE